MLLIMMSNYFSGQLVAALSLSILIATVAVANSTNSMARQLANANSKSLHVFPRINTR